MASTSLLESVDMIVKEINRRPKAENNLYFIAKLQEEAGELAEAALALEGSKRKIKKLWDAGTTPSERFLEELSDVLNVVFLFAHQRNISLDKLFYTASEKMIKKGKEIYG